MPKWCKINVTCLDLIRIESTLFSGAEQSIGLGPAVTSDIRIALLTTKDYVNYTVFDTAKGKFQPFFSKYQIIINSSSTFVLGHV